MKWLWHPKNHPKTPILEENYNCLCDYSSAKVAGFLFIIMDFGLIIIGFFCSRGAKIQDYNRVQEAFSASTLIFFAILYFIAVAFKKPIGMQIYLVLYVLNFIAWTFFYIWMLGVHLGSITTSDSLLKQIRFYPIYVHFLLMLTCGVYEYWRGQTVWVYYTYLRDRQLVFERQPTIVASNITKQLDLDTESKGKNSF